MSSRVNEQLIYHENKLRKRSLGISEQFFFHSSNHDAPFNVALSLRLKKTFNKTEYQNACKHLQQTFFLLRSIVKIDGNKPPHFEEVNDPNQPLVFLSSRSDVFWQKYSQKSIHVPFRSDELLFRIAVIDAINFQDIVITCHHLIADGKTLLIFARDFLHFLFGKKCESFFDPLTKFTIEDFISQSKESELNLINLKRRNTFKSKFHERATHTGVIYKCLSPEEAKSFFSVCRDNNITVQAGLLSSLILQIGNTSISEGFSDCVKWESPVDLRPFLPLNVSEKFTGSNIGILSFYSKIKKKNFWELAKTIKYELHSHLNASLPASIINGFQKFLTHFSKKNKNSNWSGPFVGVSNLGRIDDFFGTLNKHIEFISPVVALHANFHNKYCAYLIAHTYKGILNLAFLYPKPLLSDNEAEKCINQILDKLITFH